MFRPPRDPYPYDDDPWQMPQVRERERLRHLVFLDGRLIDSWGEQVEGTPYRELADEFDREKRPLPVEKPCPPPHQRVLTWLDAAVGGRVEVLALDEIPLSSEEAVHDDDAVTPFLAMLSKELFDDELLVAMRAALATVKRVDSELLREAPAIEVAAGLSWLVSRANVVVGVQRRVTQQAVKRVLETTVSPSKRVPRLKSSLRGLIPEPGWRPHECPDLIELGSPAYLTSETRRRLIVLRDRALEVAEREKADEHARGVLTRSRVDNLTS